MNEKEKRRQHRKEKKHQRNRRAVSDGPTRESSPPESPPDLLPDLPPRFSMEKVMRSMFGGGRRDARAKAQDLAYEAMEEESPQKALKLAARALELNPRCVDALLLVAAATAHGPQDLLERVEAAVRAGEEDLKDLDKDFFEENRGHFWGLLETRPYMRARASLASMLADGGRVPEAVGHLEEMLELNPGDNQGLRYALLGHYLALGRLGDARGLLEEFEDDPSAMFLWGRVLERFLAGDRDGAATALKEAREENRFVEDYVSGRKRLPRQLPEYYSIGDENEGIVCAVEIGKAWAKHPEAIDWLKKQR